MDRFRAERMRLLVKKMGKGFKIGAGSIIMNPGNVEIGDFSTIGRNTIIGDGGELKIGSFVMIGPYCHIVSANHQFTDWSKPMRMQKIISKSIEIEDDVWIGSGVIVLPGVKIGRGSIVGANAVVTKDVKPYSIVAGVPAVFIKYRFDNEKIKKAKNLNLKKFDPHRKINFNYWFNQEEEQSN